MEANFRYNNFKIKDDSVWVTIPDSDVARLMFYLSCVATVLKYNGFGEYIDYQQYYLMTSEDIIAIIKLALLFEPKLLIGAGIFIRNEYLDWPNRFYDITDERMNIHANEEFIIGGIIVKVQKIMVFKSSYLSTFYYAPLLRLTEPPKRKRRREYDDDCGDDCCIIF